MSSVVRQGSIVIVDWIQLPIVEDLLKYIFLGKVLFYLSTKRTSGAGVTPTLSMLMWPIYTSLQYIESSSFCKKPGYIKHSKIDQIDSIYIFVKLVILKVF